MGVRGPRLSTALGGAFVVWGLAIGWVRLHDNSFLTHVATGRLILERGIPHVDPYSFTAAGRPWVVESWLASVLYGLVERAGRGQGLLLLHVVLTGALAGGVWTLTRPAKSLIGRIVAACSALAVGTAYWAPRPLLVGLLCLCVVVVMAEEDRFSPWLLVPLMWIWANSHGSFFIGPGYLLVRLAGRRLAQRPAGRIPHLFAFAFAGTLLGAANPFGPALLGHPLVALFHHGAFAHIVEWQSPSFADPANAAYLGAALVAFVLLVARKGELEDALVLGIALAAACVASRNVAVASLLTLPVLARGLSGLGQVTGERRGLLGAAALAAVAAVGVVGTAATTRRPAYDLGHYPVAAVTFMQAHRLVPGRVVAPDYVGNYLEFRYGKRAEVFIDDRVDVYPTSVIDAYEQLLSGRAGWQRILDRYRVRTVLWPRADPLAGLVAQSPEWDVVFAYSGWVVAERSATRAHRSS